MVGEERVVYHDLKGKRALITGASRGIGRSIAEAFAQQGCDLVLTARDGDRLKDLQSSLDIYHVSVAIVSGNVTNQEDISKVFEMVKGYQDGRLDVLVNNAGIKKDGLGVRMQEEDWASVFDVNFTAARRYMQAAGRFMRKNENGGSVINISSLAGLHGHAGQSNYAASKAALNSLTQTFAGEFGAWGIRVNAICPGYIETDMTAAIADEVRQTVIKRTPIGRLGRPEDVAHEALYLASDVSSYVTGTLRVIDGGFSSQL